MGVKNIFHTTYCVFCTQCSHPPFGHFGITRNINRFVLWYYFFMQKKLVTLFPTAVWRSKLRFDARFRKDLIRECQAFREFDEHGRRWSAKHYLGGYTSYSSIANLHERSSSFELLKSSIDKEVEKFSASLELDLRGRKLVMSSFWVNIMGKLAHHSFHLHPLSVISGTYYLSVPVKSAGLKFEDPRIAHFMGSPPRKLKARQENRRHVEIRCAAGEVLLFESWLKHEVPANGDDRERISVSFNYDWL